MTSFDFFKWCQFRKEGHLKQWIKHEGIYGANEAKPPFLNKAILLIDSKLIGILLININAHLWFIFLNNKKESVNNESAEKKKNQIKPTSIILAYPWQVTTSSIVYNIVIIITEYIFEHHDSP